MNRVASYEELSGPLNRLLLSGCRTNGLPDRQALEARIAAGTLFAEEFRGGILLLEAEAEFDRLRYLLPPAAALSGWTPRRTTVAELACRPGRPADFPESDGWTTVLRRVRLTRPALALSDAASESFPPAPDADEAERILHTCFSPLTGCLPDRKALEAARSEGRLLCARGGVLDWTVKGSQTELRHLAVLPEARGQGVGASLLTEYLRRCGDRVSRVWTGEDNQAAQALYRRFGYTEDGWTSTVRLRQPTEITQTEA